MRYTLKPPEVPGGGGEGFDGLAELPRVQVDTTYSTPTGTTWTVNSGGNLQTALNSAALNDIISIEAGATFTGPFTLPNKTSGSGWIYIVSSALGSLPAAGTRVAPSDASNMPHIVSSSNNLVIEAANAAHHYRFVGLEISPTSSTHLTELVALSGSGSEANLPHHIVIDRCYIHGDATAGARRGVTLNCATAAVIDSYISDCKYTSEAQAISGWNGPGPFKIQNNYLEGAGENVMFGGSDATIQNLVTSDVEFIHNNFFKPVAWKGSSWGVKNIFELKNARRVLVEGNVFENCWAAAQIGFGVVLTPRNQDGTNTWATVEDIVFRHNVLRRSDCGFQLLGTDNNNSSQHLARVVIRNNLVIDIGYYGGVGRTFQIVDGSPRGAISTQDVTVKHNTCRLTTTGNGGLIVFGDDMSRPNEDLTFTDNISHRGVYGSGSAEGTGALDDYCSTYTFTRNVLSDAPSKSGDYPVGNYFPTTYADIGFVDLGSGDYRLSGSSPYKGISPGGTDPGIDKVALDAAMGSLASTYW